MERQRPQQTARKVEYLPPEREGIDRYAQQVCDELAQRYADPSFREREIIDGLAEFLHLAGKIQARHFSGQDSFDNAPREG